jgi:hypothetical protein
MGGIHAQEEEEMDELLLLDEEMLDAGPEDLPRRLLTNFAIYNAEVSGNSQERRNYRNQWGKIIDC